MTTKTNPSPEAQKILLMIESVDPNDTEALDEIDLAVCGYIYPFPGFYTETIKEIVSYGNISVQKKRDVSKLKYTRSRDALKAIRPDGWWLELDHSSSGYEASIETDKMAFRTFPDYGPFPTEELAELHAIIQAIDYTRGNHDHKN